MRKQEDELSIKQPIISKTLKEMRKQEDELQGKELYIKEKTKNIQKQEQELHLKKLQLEKDTFKIEQQISLQDQMKKKLDMANKMKHKLMHEGYTSTLMRKNKHSDSINNTTLVPKEHEDNLSEQKKIIAVKNRQTTTQKRSKSYTTIQRDISRPSLERKTDVMTFHKK